MKESSGAKLAKLIEGWLPLPIVCNVMWTTILTIILLLREKNIFTEEDLDVIYQNSRDAMETATKSLYRNIHP